MPDNARSAGFASLTASAALLFASAIASGCANDDAGVVTGTGGSASRGASGSATGGATSTGGGTSTGGLSGLGGSSGSEMGGTTSTGGSTSTGGASGSGGSAGSETGGTTSPGGSTSTGGASGSGGSTNAGGASGSGGSAGGIGGGAGNAGGTGGASGATGGGGGSGTSSTCASAKLCEGFESGSLDTATWTLGKSGQFTATVGTDQAHTGTHSLHVVAPNTANSAFIRETKTFPASDFWGRAWLRFNGPQGGHQVFIIVASQGDQLRALNRRSGSEAFAVNVQSTDRWYQSATLIPQNTWFCYEWHVTGTATAVYEDGTELTDIKAPGFSGATSLSLGFQRWQIGSAAGEIWVDDVAVNDTRVGCN